MLVSRARGIRACAGRTGGRRPSHTRAPGEGAGGEQRRARADECSDGRGFVVPPLARYECIHAGGSTLWVSMT